MSAGVLDVVRETLRRHAMLAGGERVLVAVSGGADSTALLLLLTRLAPEWRLELHAVHVDHGLRPDSSRDAEAVRALGARLGVPVTVVRVAVERRGSVEEAARRARYAALECEADRVGAARIAVGHTADDQAETVVMRLLEGASVRGLAGIPPVRGRVIRPLLELRRVDLAAELERAGIGWVEDPTNRERRFLRNRIRHEVLPLLAAVAAGDVVEALARVAAHARGAVEAIERIAARELRRLRRPAPDGIALPLRDLAGLPREVGAEVLRHAAAELGAGGPMRAWAHRALARALASPPPRRTLRAGGVRLEVSSGMLRVSRSSRRDRIAPRIIPVPGRVELPEAGLALEARLAPASGYQVPRQRHVAAFDASALPGPLTVRSRCRGDRFRPFGGPGERRLKSFLIDARIPRWERDRVPVVEAGGEIVWLAGLRRGAQAPVISSTSSVLELALKPLANSWPGWLQCSPEIGP